MAMSYGLTPAASVNFAGPLATPAPAIELRADTTSSSVVALTTTFTAPATCNDDLLTMLTAKSYQIWINEPLPLPGVKLDDCYPSQWVDGYTSVVGSASSIAPLVSPLVCPSGWTTQSDSTWTSGYMACCASGFTLAAPSTMVDSDRPAYGGTCYSDFTLGQEETVTVYNQSALSMTTEWTASTTPAQAYAHPIDGIALDYTPTSSQSASATTSEAGYTGGAAASTSSSDSGAARVGHHELHVGVVGALMVATLVGLVL